VESTFYFFLKNAYLEALLKQLSNPLDDYRSKRGFASADLKVNRPRAEDPEVRELPMCLAFFFGTHGGLGSAQHRRLALNCLRPYRERPVVSQTEVNN
jgi:hypothetical protein